MIVKLSLDQIIEQIKHDPVRPHIPGWVRDQVGDVFALKDDKYAEYDEPSEEIKAVICVAYTHGIAKSEEELVNNLDADTAMFYTVWSYERGAGRTIVNEVFNYLVKEREDIKYYVTLSPPTEMAKKFHLNNGAKELQVNVDTVNYEYQV